MKMSRVPGRVWVLTGTVSSPSPVTGLLGEREDLSPVSPGIGPGDPTPHHRFSGVVHDRSPSRLYLSVLGGSSGHSFLRDGKGGMSTRLSALDECQCGDL